MARAFTRAVSPRLPECALTHLERTAIDYPKAAAQHAAYEQALIDAGFEVIRLPELREDPDGVFVEDTALLLGRHAIITRPGIASRADETDSTAAGLEPHFEVHRLASGFLDGGDVLRIGRTVYVGLSSRTDAAGILALAETAGPLGYTVIEARLRDCLHLKTGVTFAGADGAGTPVLLFNEGCVDPRQFGGVEAMAIDEHEPAAANCLRIGGRLILPAGNPKTAARLQDSGFDVVALDVSELQKAEAGVTCMSLVDER
jgi:dimethylargininase